MRKESDIFIRAQAGGLSIEQVAIWLSAFLLVVITQLVSYVWAFSNQPAQLQANASPPAIMIELAPEPSAAETVEEEISEHLVEADQSEQSVEQSEPERPTPEPIPDTPTEPQIEPQELTEPIEPIEEVASESLLDKVEETPTQLKTVPVPLPRPAKPKPKKVSPKKPKKVKKKTVKSKPSKASKASKKAKVKTKKQAKVTAATQTNRGQNGARSKAKWQSRLLAHLERRKRYPSALRQKREQGIVYVRFSIDQNGKVRSARLARSSGFPGIDKEAVAMVWRASPVPKPPPNANRTITVPVRFSLKR